MIQLTPKEQEARKRVCLAVDVDNLENGFSLVDELGPYAETIKVGKSLHQLSEATPEIISRQTLETLLAKNPNQKEFVFGKSIITKIHDSPGKPKIFLDLKDDDTSGQVYLCAKASCIEGVSMFNLHVAGAEAMCKEAVRGAYEGANLKGIERPKVIGVTVLTSLKDADLDAQKLRICYEDLVKVRTELAREWGLDGVVAPARLHGELRREFGDDFTYVGPGLEWKGVKNVGQQQLYTPDKAVRDSPISSIFVIGSAVTKADDRPKAAYEILQAMAKEL